MNDECQHSDDCSAHQMSYQVQRSEGPGGLQMTDIGIPEQIQYDTRHEQESRQTCCYLCPSSTTLPGFRKATPKNKLARNFKGRTILLIAGTCALFQPMARRAFSSPWAAASWNSRLASARSCGTPLPS